MNVNRVIKVQHGDPLNALHVFLIGWWQQLGLQALLAPAPSADRPTVVTHVIDRPERLTSVNPFAPIMIGNAAALVEAFVHQRPEQKLAAILRPCELRALIELRKRRRVPAVDEAIKNGTLTIIGADCVATFPVDEYERRVKEHGAIIVTRDALMYAGEGVYSPYDLRAACRVCDWPAPRGADLVIGAIGALPDQYLLLIAHDEATDAHLQLQAVVPSMATEQQVVKREVAVGELIDKRAKVRAQQLGVTSENLMDFARLLSWISNCTLCGDCLDACPLYNGELASLLSASGAVRGNHVPLADFIALARWLTSCSGCGMCEAACEHDVPLGLLASALSHGIRGGLHEYAAGDPNRPLPWAATR